MSPPPGASCWQLEMPQRTDNAALTVAASLALAASTLESAIGYQRACDLMSVQASIRVAK
jgi:hypothetical protein